MRHYDLKNPNLQNLIVGYTGFTELMMATNCRFYECILVKFILNLTPLTGKYCT